MFSKHESRGIAVGMDPEPIIGYTWFKVMTGETPNQSNRCKDPKKTVKGFGGFRVLGLEFRV